MKQAANNIPQQQPPLNRWAIVGMNHYYIKGKKHLYVAMSKNERLIKAEGKNQPAVFKKLAKLTSDQ